MTRGAVTDWVAATNEKNEVALRLGLAIYPNFRIGVSRYLRIMYCFSTGQISIQFEDNDASHKCYLRMSEDDFQDFMTVSHLFTPLLKMIEGVTILDIDEFLAKHQGKVHRHASHPWKFVIQVNHRILVVVRPNASDQRIGELELRAISPPGEEENYCGLPYKVLSNYFIMRGAIHEYFSKMLLIQVNQAIDCWREVRSKTGNNWRELAQASKLISSGGGEVMVPVYVGHPAGGDL
jgi:hypothetical protein